jgi:hypothetical protein
MHTQTPERRLRPRDAVSGEPPRGQLEAMIVGTYREMPGLRLHLGQAARLFGLPPTTCRIVLDDLVGRGVLRRAFDGQYVTGEADH